MKKLNLLGLQFGKLFVIEKLGIDKNGSQRWLCECDCGNIISVTSYRLWHENGTRSCSKCCNNGSKRSLVALKNMSDSRKGKPLSKNAHIKLVERNKQNCGPKSSTWRGGISFKPYCIKFNKYIKEHVRNAFNRCCILCGKNEFSNGKKLDVHHVDYNKGQGCGQRWCLVPLCHKCHTKTNHYRHHYFNLLQNYWIYKYMEIDIYDGLS